MYKKIFLLLVCYLQSDNIKLQSIILLFISGFYLLFTSSKNPFVIKNQNYLENSSNCSAFLIILAGNLYITDLTMTIKEILLLFIVLFSAFFLGIWLGSTFDIFFSNNQKFFQTKLFKFYVFYKALQKTFQDVNYNGSFIFYVKELRATYQNEKISFKSLDNNDVGGVAVKKLKGKNKMIKSIAKFLNEI